MQRKPEVPILSGQFVCGDGPLVFIQTAPEGVMLNLNSDALGYGTYWTLHLITSPLFIMWFFNFLADHEMDRMYLTKRKLSGLLE